MIYKFRCMDSLCDEGTFDVKQEMNEEHHADCPKCHYPAQRVYSPIPFQFGKVDYRKDGSRDLNPDLPHVPEGTKYTPGWTKE